MVVLRGEGRYAGPSMPFLVAAALSLAGWLAWALLGLRTWRGLLRLDLAPGGPGAGAQLSVVVPCRDEAAALEPAMRSLLAQDHPALQIVAVDDRSRDGTGEILDRLATEDPRLEVIHLRELPDGWLGKNHACHVAAARCTGEWILFTDADVRFAPDALGRAIALAAAHGLGHLAGAPRLVAPGFLERAFVSAFGAVLAPMMRVWELRRPGTRGYVGIGAFNLVRRDAYERSGGHARLPLEVIDDVKLGLLLRRSGVPQGAADVATHVEVRWQSGLVASAVGLVKNGFAALEYRLGMALAAALAGIFLAAGPILIALFAPSTAARWVAAMALLVPAAYHAAWARRFSAGSGAEGLLLHPCHLLLSFVVLGSAASAHLRGGVVWRGTRYPLAALRARCLRERELPLDRVVGW